MADSLTPNFGYVMPEVGGSDNTWGTKLNANWEQADAQFKEIIDQVTALVQDKVYPVGSLYFTTVATNPATILGFGTWAAHAAGRAIVGVGTADSVAWTVNQTRGEAAHLLATSEIPAHAHAANPPAQTFTTGGNSRGHTHSVDPPATTSSGNGGHNHGGLTGADGSHNHQIFSGESSSVGSISLDNPAGGGQRFYNSTSNLAYFDNLNSWTQSAYTSVPRNLDDTGRHTHSIASVGDHSHSVNIAAFNSGAESQNHTHSVTVDISAYNTSNAGGGGTHNNIQPSIAVYIWKRTA